MQIADVEGANEKMSSASRHYVPLRRTYCCGRERARVDAGTFRSDVLTYVLADLAVRSLTRQNETGPEQSSDPVSVVLLDRYDLTGPLRFRELLDPAFRSRPRLIDLRFGFVLHDPILPVSSPDLFPALRRNLDGVSALRRELFLRSRLTGLLRLRLDLLLDLVDRHFVRGLVGGRRFVLDVTHSEFVSFS